MHTVADQFGAAVRTVECGTDDSRSTMSERRHGIVKVGGVSGTTVIGLFGSLIICSCMGQRNGNLVVECVDEFHGTLVLRGDINQFDETAGTLLKAAEKRFVTEPDVFGSLSSFFCLAYEWPFHVDPYQGSLPRTGRGFVIGTCRIHNLHQ